MNKLLLNLGNQPLVNNLSSSREESLLVEKYPLVSYYDENLTISLSEEINPDILYKNYLYHSGVNVPYIEHCRKLYDSIKHLNLSVVIDIGGNDGTLLKTFREESKTNKFWSGISPKRLINVDASESFRDKNESEDIEYICGFFNEHMDLPKANLITSTNVFQHTKDIHSFLRGIQKHLDGVWVLEFPYTYETLCTLQFDQFYHEHYYYWLVTPLEKLFHQYGLKIINIKRSEIHGGSLQMWMTNKSPSSSEITSIIEDYKNKEQKLELSLFNSKVEILIQKSKDYIFSLPGKTAFFAAAAKGCVFLNSLGLNINNMPDSYVIDDTVEKQGLFFPGTGLQIHGRKMLKEQPVDNIIILAHNFKDYIIDSLRGEYQGKVITMLPTIYEEDLY